MATKSNTAKPAAKKAGEFDRFMALTDEQRAAEMAQYDGRVIPLSETRPLTPAERRSFKKWQAKAQANHAAKAAAVASPVKRKMGRPATGVTTQAINTTVDKALLAEADAYAKSVGLKRTQLIAAGLRLAMANRVTPDTLDA